MEDKKMYCPMTFSNSNERGAWNRCDPKCAWAFEWNGKLSCVIAIQSVGMQGANTQPMERDA